MDVGAHAFAVLVAVAAVAGFIDAIAGGGGLLTLPALLAAGLPPVTAIATSKLQSSLGTLAATLAYARRGQVQFRAMAAPAAAAFVAAGAGSLTVQKLDPRFLEGLVPILLIAIALYFLLAPKLGDAERPRRIGLFGFSALALALGFYDGFFGPGTGAFFVVALILLMGLHLVSATANTKLLNLASNVGSLLVMALGGHVIVLLGLGMAAGGMIGGQLGAMTAIKVGPRIIRPLLVLVSLALTVRLLLQPGNPIARLIWRQ